MMSDFTKLRGELISNFTKSSDSVMKAYDEMMKRFEEGMISCVRCMMILM